MLIDFHTHIFSPDLCANREKYLKDKNFKHLYSSKNTSTIDHISLLDSMIKNDIDKSVAMGFPWLKETLCKKQNDYLIFAKEESQGRILPFGSIPLYTKNIYKWAKKLKEDGFLGIGEIGFYSKGFDKKAENYLIHLIEVVQDLSLPLCIHVNEPVGHKYIGKYEPSLSRLYSAVTRFPEASIIFSHWGGGLIFYELMPEIFKSFNNFYYDTAASPYIYDDLIYEIAIKIKSPDKILFGSDFPLINFKKYIKSIKNICSKNQSELILGKNSAQLLGIKI